MKPLATIFLSMCFLFGKTQITYNPILYDNKGNIIESVGYVVPKKYESVSFKDTITNSVFKLDSTHKIITAFNSKGDTLWKVNPYKVLLDAGKLDKIHRVDEIQGLRFEVSSSLNYVNKTEKKLRLKSTGHTVYCFVDLKNGLCRFAGQD